MTVNYGPGTIREPLRVTCHAPLHLHCRGPANAGPRPVPSPRSPRPTQDGGPLAQEPRPPPRRGYCQILWMTVSQAAGFSFFTPSLKTTPSIPSGRSFEPFKARHPVEADSINLYTIVRHADRLPLPLVLV